MTADAAPAVSQKSVSDSVPNGVSDGVPNGVADGASDSGIESASAEQTALPAWLTESEQRVWRRLLAAECRLRERLDRELQEAHDMSLGDYDVLVHLSEADGGSLRMSELAERLLLSRSGLTRRVDGLVRAGWVERKACPDDGRGSLAVLTPAGFEQLRSAAPTHVRGVRQYVIDVLAGTTGLDGLERGLSAVEAALDGRRYS